MSRREPVKNNKLLRADEAFDRTPSSEQLSDRGQENRGPSPAQPLVHSQKVEVPVSLSPDSFRSDTIREAHALKSAFDAILVATKNIQRRLPRIEVDFPREGLEEEKDKIENFLNPSPLVVSRQNPEFSKRNSESLETL